MAQARYGRAMQALFYAMAGGAVGAGLRFEVGAIVDRLSGSAPVATLTVNMVGALCMGLLAGLIAARGWGDGVRQLLGVGLLGGFTTFSAFSLEAVRMAQAGHWGVLSAYVAASVIGTTALAWLGLTLALTAVRGA